jgi:surface protein
MSFRNVQQNSIENRNTQSIPTTAAARSAGTGWIRNPSWLTMPAITSSNEEVDILVAIYPESNFVALTFNTSAGTYSVDWGDGTSGTFTSATAAQKQYDFTNVALDGTNAPVTFQQSGSTVTRTSHGYTNGYPISFASITTTTGITATQIYYVINATTDTFQLAASRGGTALTLTNDGTGIILPYKQAIVKVAPTTGGATLTTVNLGTKNTTTNLQTYVQPVLDLTISAACTSLTIGAGAVPLSLIENCTILRHNTTNFGSLFINCISLQSVSISNTASVILMNSMFQGCSALATAPSMNTANVTNMSTMFYACSSLVTVPFYDTIKNTTMASMFQLCGALQTIPLFNTANVTNMASTFATAYSLQTLPLLDTIKVTNMDATFINCRSLQTIPLFNTANVTGMPNMFNSCISLQTIPLLNTIKNTNMQGMFAGCTSLQSIPLLNTSNVGSLNAAFSSCTSLKTIPLLNTANCGVFTSMFSSSGIVSLSPISIQGELDTTFQACASLQTLPVITGPINNYTGAFTNCQSVSSIGGLNGAMTPVSVASLKLSGPALDVIYTSLGPVGGAVTFQANPANTVTLVAHGYSNGATIRFSTITTTTGISTFTTYYVRNVTTDTFQLSTTPTGAIRTLTNNGTGTRQSATITVTSNWGTASDTPSIATAKGWVVTGS